MGFVGLVLARDLGESLKNQYSIVNLTVPRRRLQDRPLRESGVLKRATIFILDKPRQLSRGCVRDRRAEKSFVKTLEEACEKFDWELSAYCLMSNH